ncbi:hypothetical protein ACNOYE_30970 [Nannocystaceae bacterium ST9]
MGILDRDPSNYDYTKAKKEADAIVTATVIGFAATRALLSQPFSFDMQDADKPTAGDDFAREVAKWDMLLDAVSHVLGGLHHLVAHNAFADNLRLADIRDAVQDGVAPTTGAISNQGRDSTITGRPGGASLEAARRWRRTWMPPIEGAEPEYAGRGAYTGVCDDPLRLDCWLNYAVEPDRSTLANLATREFGENLVLVPEVKPLDRYPTKMLKLAPNDLERFRPADDSTWLAAKQKDDPEKAAELMFGEIHSSNEKDPPIGFGVANDPQAKLIGYVHGMCQAVVESTKRGPWCVAHEHAIGLATTKLASCFACTTYMYAAGFPPSSCHLGRGESWVPPPEDGDAGAALLTKSINSRWHIECAHYLLLGARLLHEYFRGDGLEHPNNEYAPIVASIAGILDGDSIALTLTRDLARLVTIGGNLFLDALVHHDSDYVRMMNVLGISDLDGEDVARYQRVLIDAAELPEARKLEVAMKAMRDIRKYRPQWARAELARQAERKK